MAKVVLHIDDPVNRMTLKAMLEAEGHPIVDAVQEADVAVADSAEEAAALAKGVPTLLLAAASDIDQAVQAMRGGVFGYIFLPFQPGEAALMVVRALRAGDVSERPDDDPLLSLEEVESRHILAVLRRCKNNQAKAARLLGIGRNTLWRKLRKIRAGQAAKGA